MSRQSEKHKRTHNEMEKGTSTWNISKTNVVSTLQHDTYILDPKNNNERLFTFEKSPKGPVLLKREKELVADHLVKLTDTLTVPAAVYTPYDKAVNLPENIKEDDIILASFMTAPTLKSMFPKNHVIGIDDKTLQKDAAGKPIGAHSLIEYTESQPPAPEDVEASIYTTAQRTEIEEARIIQCGSLKKFFAADGQEFTISSSSGNVEGVFDARVTKFKFSATGDEKEMVVDGDQAHPIKVVVGSSTDSIVDYTEKFSFGSKPYVIITSELVAHAIRDLVPRRAVLLSCPGTQFDVRKDGSVVGCKAFYLHLPTHSGGKIPNGIEDLVTIASKEEKEEEEEKE